MTMTAAVRVPRACRGLARAAVVALAAVLGVACGSSPITPARVEGAVAPTFANLVQTQVAWMGLPPLSAPEVHATARCRRVSDGGSGSGEWICTVVWLGPQGQSLRDTYDLFVNTDGCYTAAISGEALGGPTLTTSGGRVVRNLLYAFDGCFDTT